PPDRDEDGEKLDATGSMVKYYKVPVAGNLARKIQNNITSEEILVDPKKLNDPELKDYFQILAKYYGEINSKQPIINNLFNKLKKEIEDTQRPNAIKLIDSRDLNQRINNLKLSPNLISDLQKIRISKLDKLRVEQYSYYIDLKDKTEKITTLNNLFNTINDDKVLTTLQISILLKSITDKIFKINQKQEYDSIKNRIDKEKDSTRLKTIWKDTIDEAKYLDNKQKAKLHKLRNNQK
ncbi:12277_t:CDS:2, partial [Racocetra persica]